nr:hypothetical protein [Brevundimonas naejangsanensis]
MSTTQNSPEGGTPYPDAQQLLDARNAQVQAIIDKLMIISAEVVAMKTSDLDGFALWHGGLPDRLANSGAQARFLAGQLAENFGLPQPPQAEPAEPAA